MVIIIIIIIVSFLGKDGRENTEKEGVVDMDLREKRDAACQQGLEKGAPEA